jgi:hypothetical protein
MPFARAHCRYARSIVEIAPELTGHGLPLSKCGAYNRVYDQPCESHAFWRWHSLKEGINKGVGKDYVT